MDVALVISMVFMQSSVNLLASVPSAAAFATLKPPLVLEESPCCLRHPLVSVSALSGCCNVVTSNFDQPWFDIVACTSATMSHCNQNASKNAMSRSESWLQRQTLPRTSLLVKPCFWNLSHNVPCNQHDVSNVTS